MIGDDAALLVGFLNTAYLPEGADGLAGSGVQEWIADGYQDDGRSLAPNLSPGPGTGLDGLRDLREGLRWLTRPDWRRHSEAHAVVTGANLALATAPVLVQLVEPDSDAPSLRAQSSGQRQLIVAVAAAYLRCHATGELARLKTCAQPECRWAFYDASRNCSRRWCDMSVCGNQMKNRQYRARRTS